MDHIISFKGEFKENFHGYKLGRSLLTGEGEGEGRVAKVSYSKTMHLSYLEHKSAVII